MFFDTCDRSRRFMRSCTRPRDTWRFKSITHLISSMIHRVCNGREGRSVLRCDRSRSSGRLPLQPQCVFLFEVIDEPATCRPWRAVSPEDGRHCYDEALGRSLLGENLNELAACEVRLDYVVRHEAEPEPCAQEGKLRPQMGQEPRSRGQ